MLGNNLNGFNQFLSLEHSFLLFDCNSSAMKITFYSSRQRLIVSLNPGLLFKNGNFWELQLKQGLLTFSELCMFSLSMLAKVSAEIVLFFLNR